QLAHGFGALRVEQHDEDGAYRFGLVVGFSAGRDGIAHLDVRGLDGNGRASAVAHHGPVLATILATIWSILARLPWSPRGLLHDAGVGAEVDGVDLVGGI